MAATVPPHAQPRRSSCELFVAAWMYYEEGATQAQIARHLNVSRPTVSRLLAEARSQGIVRISVVNPNPAGLDTLSVRLSSALDIDKAYVEPGSHVDQLGSGLTQATREAVRDLTLQPGSVFVVSSGQSVYEVVQRLGLDLTSIQLVPAVGGQSEPEPWHQTNEIVRLAAAGTGATPHFIFAPAMPSPVVYDALQEDPGFRQIQGYWNRASAILVGVGAPTATRTSLSSSVPSRATALQTAVGDVCLHFYNLAGELAEFPGHDRMIKIPYETLIRIPHRIAVAAGAHKALSIHAGAKLRLFDRIVTDEVTARAVIALAGGSRSAHSAGV